MKVHLLTSDEPLIEKGTLQALCGRYVPDVLFALRWDSGLLEMPEDFEKWLTVCWRCRFAFTPTRRYVYAIVSGQESVRALEESA